MKSVRARCLNSTKNTCEFRLKRGISNESNVYQCFQGCRCINAQFPQPLLSNQLNRLAGLEPVLNLVSVLFGYGITVFLQDRCEAGVIGIVPAVLWDCMIGSLAKVVSGIVTFAVRSPQNHSLLAS